MAVDAKIDEAIRIGEKNRRTAELVANWCAHVSIQKAGGVGMIEVQTGLPIGPHSLSCPHAPADGIAAWDLVDSALDFHDRNCVDCKFRKPVGLPNLATLLAERDQRRAAEQEVVARAEQAALARRAAREAARNALRANLNPISVTTLDLIAELDGKDDSTAGDKLVETARLAPESFTPAIRQHLFDLAQSRELALAEPSLRVLALLTEDRGRLINLALQLLSAWGMSGAAAEIIAGTDLKGDPALVAEALPALIHLAAPAQAPFLDPPPPCDEPLRRLFRRQPDDVKAGLSAMLSDSQARTIGAVARAISLLSEDDPSLVGFLTDDLLARLVRAKWLISGRDDEVREVLHNIRRALAAAFDRAPQAVDKLIQDYLPGASVEGEEELHFLYRDVLHRDWRDRNPVPLTEANRLAFRRLVVAATKLQGESGHDAITDIARGRADELAQIAAENVDLLLGCAALVFQRRDEILKAKPDPRDPLAGLTRYGLQSRAHHLAECLVGLACIGARHGEPAAIDGLLGFLSSLPEGDDELRAAIIEDFPKLAQTTEGLKQCLPAFYSALVGSSNLQRAAAARALAEMPRPILKNMPALVFEAFIALLGDRYLVVHKAAVRALERFSLPDVYHGDVRHNLANLVGYYAETHQDDAFLVRALVLYAHRCVSEEALAGPAGDRLLSILRAVPADVVMQEAHGAPSVLSNNPNWIDLVLHLLAHTEATEYHVERLVEQLDRVRPELVRREAGRVADAGIRVAQHQLWQMPAFIEVLSAAGAWSEAARMVREIHATITDTTERRVRRLHLALYRVSCDVEAALAAGEADRIDTLIAEWRNTDTDYDNAQNVRRERASRSIFGAP